MTNLNSTFSFTINTLAEQCNIKEAVSCNSQYRLIFLNKGACQYLLDKRPIAVDEFCIGIVRPNQTFENMNYIAAEGYVLSFSYEYLQLAMISSPLIQHLHLSISQLDTVPVPLSEHSFLVDVSGRLMQEYGMTKGMREEVVRGLFQVFVLYLSRATAQLKPDIEMRSNKYTKRFFSLLDQHFRTLKMPADYADLMAVTPAYLNNVMKENLGFTTSYFIQQRILTEAKRLMMFEELNMKEVAYNLGFFDVSHFSKFFKRITGKCFSDFKRNVAA